MKEFRSMKKETEIIRKECSCCRRLTDQEDLIYNKEEDRLLCKDCNETTPQHRQYLNRVQ